VAQLIVGIQVNEPDEGAIRQKHWFGSQANAVAGERTGAEHQRVFTGVNQTNPTF